VTFGGFVALTGWLYFVYYTGVKVEIEAFIGSLSEAGSLFGSGCSLSSILRYISSTIGI
jgi:hypothetical protein